MLSKLFQEYTSISKTKPYRVKTYFLIELLASWFELRNTNGTDKCCYNTRKT